MAAFENTRVRPGAICRRQPHPREAAAVEPRTASRPSSPHTGATHGGRLRCSWRGGHGSHGGAAGRTTIRSAILPARRVPSHSPAEPRRSRGGGAASPVPGAGWRRAWRRGTGLGAPPAGNPLGQPWDKGPEPPCQVTALTSRDLARISWRPYPLCHSRVGWPWTSQLTSPSFAWKLI